MAVTAKIQCHDAPGAGFEVPMVRLAARRRRAARQRPKPDRLVGHLATQAVSAEAQAAANAALCHVYSAMVDHHADG